MIGLAADNCNTMMGDKTGLKALMKKLCPDIFVLGCSCHSLHLCASYATEKLPNSVEAFLKDVYNYFARSSQRTNDLKEFQDFCMQKNHKILYLSATRCLSLGLVVNRVLEQWNSLTLYFKVIEDKMDETAKAIHNALKNPIFKLYLSFLSYVLDLITKVNIDFQSEYPKFPEVLSNITTLYRILLKCFIKKEVLEKTSALNKIVVNNPSNYLPLQNFYVGAKADFIEKDPNSQIPSEDLQHFKKRCLDFLIEVCKQIKNRFDFEDPHLVFALNFVPNAIKSNTKRSITEWVYLFPYLKLDMEVINVEWQLLLETVSNFYDDDLTRFWRKVYKAKNSLGQPMFPNLMTLVKVILCLPHSSAAERIFSNLNIIKNKVRNKLKLSTC